jgi:hypothetical protein
MAEIANYYPGNIDFPTETEGPFQGIIYGGLCAAAVNFNSDNVPPTGPYEYLTNEGTNGTININIGDLTFTPESDNSGTPGWPIIQFNNGDFVGVAYYSKYTQEGVTSVFSANGLDWNITNPETNDVLASGTFSNQPE